MSRFIDANLLDKRLEKLELISNEIDITEYQFEPLPIYATSIIPSTYSYSIPLQREYRQCKHCGAPGQVVGELCEYCEQVVNE